MKCRQDGGQQVNGDSGSSIRSWARKLDSSRDPLAAVRKAEEEEKQRAQERAREEEQARIQAQEAEQARVQAEEDEQARLRAEEEELARRKAEEQQQARLRAEEEQQARRKAEQEQQARRRAEQEQQARKRAEEEQQLVSRLSSTLVTLGGVVIAHAPSQYPLDDPVHPPPPPPPLPCPPRSSEYPLGASQYFFQLFQYPLERLSIHWIIPVTVRFIPAPLTAPQYPLDALDPAVEWLTPPRAMLHFMPCTLVQPASHEPVHCLSLLTSC